MAVPLSGHHQTAGHNLFPQADPGGNDPPPNAQAEAEPASRREPYLLQHPADYPLPRGQSARPGADRAAGVSGGQALWGVLPSLSTQQ